MSPARPRRLRYLAAETVLGIEVPVADTRMSRLLGLALLDRRQAGNGLLLPRCRSIHTFGMRFKLDIFFLGYEGQVVAVRRNVGPGRIHTVRHADRVLELVSA